MPTRRQVGSRTSSAPTSRQDESAARCSSTTSTSSTNDVAAEYARNPDNNGLVVFAEEQTAGRGRTGATWQGGREESLLFSIALVDCRISNELLSLTCAVGVAEAIGQVGGCPAGIKWPNDIMLDGKKVAGILLESKGQRIRGRAVLARRFQASGRRSPCRTPRSTSSASASTATRRRTAFRPTCRRRPRASTWSAGRGASG